MKHFCLLCALFLLVGCSKDEDPGRSYTELQKKAFAIFNGTWADTQFSNLLGGELGSLLPEPDKIVFGKHHQNPIEVYKDDYMNGKIFLYDNQGECIYYDMPYKDAEYEIVECYYNISQNADYLRLYRRNDNSLYKRFDMSIKSDTKMHLHDPDLSLPYIFVKQ